MKKRFLLVAAVAALVTMGATAQTEKGKIIVSGSSDLSFSSMKMTQEYDGKDQGEETKTTQFGLTPAVGYFVMDNLAVTLTVSLDNSKDKTGDVEETTSTNMFGPGVKYFFGTSNIKPYVQGDVMFGSYKQKYDDGDPDNSGESKSKLFGYDLGAGVAIFLNDYVALDFGLGYAGVTATDNDDDKFKIKTGGIALQGGITVVF